MVEFKKYQVWLLGYNKDYTVKDFDQFIAGFDSFDEALAFSEIYVVNKEDYVEDFQEGGFINIVVETVNQTIDGEEATDVYYVDTIEM